MGGFDIANMRNRKSFAASIRKRKALGLNDSDSDDDTPKRKNVKKVVKKNVESENDLDELSILTTKPVKPKENAEVIEIDPAFKLMQEALNTTDQYLAEAEALMSKPVNVLKRADSNVNKKERTPKVDKPTYSNNSSVIEITNDDDDNNDVEEEISLADDDIEDLDPELAKLLREMPSTHARKASKVSIRISYVHNFTDLSESTKAVMDKLIKPVKIIILDNDQFHTAINAFCKKKNLKKDEIVLTYKNNLVFLNSSPAGVGMTDVGTYPMEVYPLKCYNDMQIEKEARRLEMRRKLAEDTNNDSDTHYSYTPSAEAEQTQEETRIVLKLRDNNGNELSMRVKPTSILNSLVTSYKQHSGITTDVKLSFEGEVLDLNQTIEETDLEDEDLIEVLH